MTDSGQLSDTEIECRLLWRLVRVHGWSQWVPRDALVNNAVPPSDQGRAKTICDDLKMKPYINFQRGQGFRIVGNTENRIALFLRDICGYTEIQIESSLSHFDGFDRLERDDE